MNTTFSSKQISQTGNLVSDLVSRQYKLKLMAPSIEHKIDNATLKQSEIAKMLGISKSTLQRCRKDINMLSP